MQLAALETEVGVPTERKPISKAQIDAAFAACLELQRQGTDIHQKHPFAALLLAPDNETILLTHLSIGQVQHAETELARLAAVQYLPTYLWCCTLVTTWEPCVMCSGTLYWANIGRCLYAASEDELNKLTGSGNKENMTMSLPCREVLNKGQKDVDIIGPVEGWEAKTIRQSAEWWNKHKK